MLVPHQPGRRAAGRDPAAPGGRPLPSAGSRRPMAVRHRWGWRGQGPRAVVSRRPGRREDRPAAAERQLVRLVGHRNPPGGHLDGHALGRAWSNLVFWPLTRTYPIVVDVERADYKPFGFSPDGRWVAVPWEEGSLGLLPVPFTGERSVTPAESAVHRPGGYHQDCLRPCRRAPGDDWAWNGHLGRAPGRLRASQAAGLFQQPLRLVGRVFPERPPGGGGQLLRHGREEGDAGLGPGNRRRASLRSGASRAGRRRAAGRQQRH